jgi:integrase
VRVFLVALKHFYQMACRAGWYAYANPLTDSVSQVLHEVEAEEGCAAGRRPRMPALSGVEVPRGRSCSENYFRLQEEQWVPQPMDDPSLPVRLMQGMRALTWGLRDQIVVRMAYESGARIREVLCLTVGDWRARGCSQEATTFNKGSRGRRVKVIRFSSETARMLRAYVNTERSRWDGQQRRLEQLEDQDPLFVSRRGKPYDYEAFKPHWYALCAKVAIDLNIHGLRHWYVTQAMRQVSESAQTPAEVMRGKEDLIRYMGWRSAETLGAYEHFFQAERHASIQDQVYQRIADLTTEAMHQCEQAVVPIAGPVLEDAVVQDGWAMLLALGGAGGGRDATTTNEA